MDRWMADMVCHHHPPVMARYHYHQYNLRILSRLMYLVSTTISTSTLPMFFKASRRTAPVRQYRPVRCHLQTRTSPLRARRVVRNSPPKAPVHPSELFLTSAIQIASHVIFQTNKDHGMNLASRDKPLYCMGQPAIAMTCHVAPFSCRGVKNVRTQEGSALRQLLHPQGV